MKEGPGIVRIAALVGDHARAEVLTALMTDRALTASELAGIAGVTKQTMSAHLAKLVDAGLIVADPQGRHRYFRLADPDVAALVESLMGVAFRTGAVRLRGGPREPALRKARVCYDHLAGELAVLAFEHLLERRVFVRTGALLCMTAEGNDWFRALGIEPQLPNAGRRTLLRPCMDWGERRHHLAGALGAALLERVQANGWAKRARRSRVMAFDAQGESAFRALFTSRDAVPGTPLNASPHGRGEPPVVRRRIPGDTGNQLPAKRVASLPLLPDPD